MMRARLAYGDPRTLSVITDAGRREDVRLDSELRGGLAVAGRGRWIVEALH